MSESPLTFSPDLHEYRLGDRRLASVTEVLEAVLRTSSPWWTPAHRFRGTAVHAIVAAINQGDYDPAGTVFPASWTEADRDGVTKRTEAYQNFVESTGYESLFTELRVHSESMGIAGTLDTIGYQRKGSFADKLTLIDLKSGQPTPSSVLQVSLYSQLVQELPPMMGWDKLEIVRVVLHCQPNGKSRPVFRYGSEAKQDDADARAVLRTFRFLERHNLLQSKNGSKRS